MSDAEEISVVAGAVAVTAPPISQQQSPKKRAPTASSVDGDLILGSKRARKQTTFIEISKHNAPKVERTDVAVTASQGSGSRLAENEVFVKEVDRHRGDSELLKALHSLFYGTPGKKTEIKKNLRSFSGFPDGTSLDEKASKIIEKKKFWTTSQLKTAAAMFGIERSGDREALAKRLVEYVAAPTPKELKGAAAKKKKASAMKASKSSSSSKSKGNGKGKGKGKAAASGKGTRISAPSAYLLFSQSQRADVKKQFPDLSFGELTKKVAESWRELDDAAKKPWEAAAAAAKAALGLDSAAAASGDDAHDDGAEEDDFNFDEDLEDEEEEEEGEDEQEEEDEDAGADGSDEANEDGADVDTNLKDSATATAAAAAAAAAVAVVAAAPAGDGESDGEIDFDEV